MELKCPNTWQQVCEHEIVSSFSVLHFYLKELHYTLFLTKRNTHTHTHTHTQREMHVYVCHQGLYSKGTRIASYVPIWLPQVLLCFFFLFLFFKILFIYS